MREVGTQPHISLIFEFSNPCQGGFDWLGLAHPMVLPITKLPGWGSGVDGWSSLACLWSDIYVIPTEKMALHIKAGICCKKEKAGMLRGWEKQMLTPDLFFGMVYVEFS